MKKEDRMLRNFINKYGLVGLKRISSLFIEGISNQQIAEEFGVTRQRVHQWQQAFTQKKISLRPHVKEYLG